MSTRKIVDVLEELGVPDRYGLIGGMRKRIAELLLVCVRQLGEEKFRRVANELVEAVVQEAASLEEA